MSDERQVARTQSEGDKLRLTRGERDLAERLELANRPGDARNPVVHVKLNDLFRGPRAAIGDPCTDPDLAVHRHRRGAERQLAIFDLPVGEAMAERIERAVGDAAKMGLVRLELGRGVWPTGRFVRVVIRLLAGA